jgi:hypothetical protein
VTRGIRPEALYLKKPRNLILNQLNIEGLTWKRNINYTKGSQKKIAMKRI